MLYSNWGRPAKNDVYVAPAMLLIIGLFLLVMTVADIPGPIDSPWDFFDGEPPYWVFGSAGLGCVFLGLAMLLLHFKRERVGEKVLVAAGVQFALVGLWVAFDMLAA